jgi:carboxy-cis,cis-muconate cyclase
MPLTNTRAAKANDADTKTRAIFLLPAKKPPYAVYCNPFYDYAGYGNVFSVNASGHMTENIQNYEYCEKTAIHGMVFDPSETYLYSADMWANRIWCHKKIDDEGRLETVGFTEAPAPKDHPRWVEMHPSGNYLYALMEAGNRLCEYVIDPQTKLPVYTHKTYPLIPPGKSTVSNYCISLLTFVSKEYPMQRPCTGPTLSSSPNLRSTSSQPHARTPSRLRVTSRRSRSALQEQLNDKYA